MQPTLNSADDPNAFGINDFVLVEKWTSRAHWYRRGDVVLLRCEPEQKSVLLLPRRCTAAAPPPVPVVRVSQARAARSNARGRRHTL
jgi:signal peptidase I